MLLMPCHRCGGRKSGEKDFDDDGVGGAAFGEPGDEASFEKLKNADREEGGCW